MDPSDYLYSEEHEWLKVEGETCLLGVTQFAQQQLGDVVFVDMPEAGTHFGAHDSIGSVESVKAVAEVYTPVGGEILEINGALETSPELINSDPYGEGWLVRMRLINAEADLARLMDAEAYAAFVESSR